ncbi:hypothetical protein NliqN6_5719 [Naganishia liquefaciens]|uniref:SWIRM-domain-containing protein n=1 Tax=Naganishia liquefaciens TaxID=104408 RepID=A0A8H3TY88_9TREE|nr:hypothetical protein NliqN6_5719 [Naganishia liquefaciens]
MQVDVSSNPDVVAHDQSSAPGKERERDPILGGQVSNITNGINGTPAPEDEQTKDDPDAMEDDPQVLHNLAVTYLAAQTHPLIIPSYASWFSFATIHPLERRSLPEFFSGKNRSKTPAIYKDYRDFMMNTYRLNPSEYLTVTACRRNLAGDVGAIMRVHAFLEQWGLVNYQVDPETRPAPLGPPFTGHFRVTLDTPKGLQPLHPGTRPPANLPKPAKPAGPAASSNLDLRKTIYSSSTVATRPLTPQEAQKTINEQAAELRSRSGPSAKRTYTCDTCGTDCTRTRYHSLKDGQYTLCVACYTSGRFPATMHSGGFVRMDEEAFKHALGSSTAAEWTDQETLLLLEGIEMYDEDWDKVAVHVATRSKEQCVMHFLQLPIEDEYLNEPDAQLGPLQYSTNAGGVAGLEGLPFAQADNPVMSVVAFLASAVGPGVAAAAAQSALGELTNGLKTRIQKDKPEEKPKADAEAEAEPAAAAEAETEIEGKTDDKTEGMDVDQEQATEPVKPAEESTEPPAEPDASLPRSQVERAAALALGAAAAKASTLAVHEERHIQSLVTRLIQAQTRKLESKISMFEKFEELLEQEKRNVEIAKQQFFKDRLALVGQLRQVQGLLTQARQLNAGPINEQVVKQAEELEKRLAPVAQKVVPTTAGSAAEVPQSQVQAQGEAAIELPEAGTYATLS